MTILILLENRLCLRMVVKLLVTQKKLEKNYYSNFVNEELTDS